AWRWPARDGDGSGPDGLCLRLVRRVHFVLDGGEARRHESGERAVDSCFADAPFDESAAGFPGAFFAGRMDCLRAVGCVGSRPALGKELKYGSCILSKAKRSPTMIPFLHLGPLSIPTFGLMVATARMAASYVLQAAFYRRRDGFLKQAYL